MPRNSRFAVRSALLLLLAPLAMSGVARAQGPSAPRFESLVEPALECTLPECHVVQSGRRRSRLGRSVLVGVVIGASVAFLTATLAGGFCAMDDTADAQPCAETVALTAGITVGAGALIGLLVGASEPSRGPVPTD